MPSVVAAEVQVTGSLVAALAPLILLVVGFLAWCEYDLYRAGTARALPRWVWALIILASVPLGGILYLLFGREPRSGAGRGRS